MTDNALHSSNRVNWLERCFALRSRGGTLRTECLVGITDFLAAAYLLVVIPGLLAIGGMDKGAATTGIILVLAVGPPLMVFYANLPLIVGPGIGGSVLVGVTLAGSEGIGQQTGLGIACWSGILFLLLTRFGPREAVTRSVSQPIKLGFTAPIGLFVAALGSRDAGLVLANAKTNALMLGDFLVPGAPVALCDLFLAITLQARKIPGAILWVTLCAMPVGIPSGVAHLSASSIDVPHSLTLVLGRVDLLGASNIVFLPFPFAFLASESLSTMGTTLAVGGGAGLLDEEGNMPQINRLSMVDSIAAALGPRVGIPAVMALVKSSAAVEAGGKTGLVALSAAVMFLLTLLFTPVALMIPKEVTTLVLILIGLNMFSGLRRVDPGNFTDGLPVLMMVMITPIVNSFDIGIVGGLLFYTVIKAITGKWREIPIGLRMLVVSLVYYFATLVRH